MKTQKIVLIDYENVEEFQHYIDTLQATVNLLKEENPQKGIIRYVREIQLELKPETTYKGKNVFVYSISQEYIVVVEN